MEDDAVDAAASIERGDAAPTKLVETLRAAYVVAQIVVAGVWLDLVLVPAIQWNAGVRMIYKLIVSALYWVHAGVAVATFDSYKPQSSPFSTTRTHDWRQRTNVVSFFTACALAILAVFQIYYAAETNGTGALVGIRTPCGASSCSSHVNTKNVVYNAAGWFSAFTPPFSQQSFTVCVYAASECEWASQAAPPYTGVVFGYPPLPPLNNYPDLAKPPCAVGTVCPASNLPEGYPDGSVGLANGLLWGANTTDVPLDLCPGVQYKNGVAVGTPVCSVCSKYWREVLHYVESGTEHCDYAGPGSGFDSDGKPTIAPMCAWFCPRPQEVRTPEAMWNEMWIDVALVLLFFPTAPLAIEFLLWTISQRPIDAVLEEVEDRALAAAAEEVVVAAEEVVVAARASRSKQEVEEEADTDTDDETASTATGESEASHLQ